MRDLGTKGGHMAVGQAGGVFCLTTQNEQNRLPGAPGFEPQPYGIVIYFRVTLFVGVQGYFD